MTQIKIVVTGFILIFLTGYWLNRKGQPFNTIVLAIHKLITIATIAYLVLTVLRISRIAPLSPVEWIVFIWVAVVFLLTVASGGWLSAVKIVPAAVRTLHHILPFLTALSTAAAFYLFFLKE